jgi:ArsR family transcriptional regulator
MGLTNKESETKLVYNSPINEVPGLEGASVFEFMNVTKALSDENRVRILTALNGKDLRGYHIKALLQVSTSTVSRHLSILRNARLISTRKKGRWTYYKLANSPEPRTIADAINWVIRSVNHDPVIKRDQHHLKEILSRESGCRR